MQRETRQPGNKRHPRVSRFGDQVAKSIGLICLLAVALFCFAAYWFGSSQLGDLVPHRHVTMTVNGVAVPGERLGGGRVPS
jgi:hypothetical protein